MKKQCGLLCHSLSQLPVVRPSVPLLVWCLCRATGTSHYHLAHLFVASSLRDAFHVLARVAPLQQKGLGSSHPNPIHRYAMHAPIFFSGIHTTHALCLFLATPIYNVWGTLVWSILMRMQYYSCSRTHPTSFYFQLNDTYTTRLVVCEILVLISAELMQIVGHFIWSEIWENSYLVHII